MVAASVLEEEDMSYRDDGDVFTQHVELVIAMLHVMVKRAGGKVTFTQSDIDEAQDEYISMESKGDGRITVRATVESFKDAH